MFGLLENIPSAKIRLLEVHISKSMKVVGADAGVRPPRSCAGYQATASETLTLTPDTRYPKPFLALLVALLLFAACTPTPLESGDLLITLTRDGNCLDCPWYSVSIFADGHVQFKGIAGTVAHGERYTIVDHDSLQRLAEDIIRLKFFAMQDRYDTRKFYDGSTTTLDVRFRGMHKKVIDHYGAPDSLHYIESRIDQLSGANFWIGGGAEPPNPNSREAREQRHRIDSLEAIDDEMLQQYQNLRDKGETRQAFHLFHEERKLNDSIARAYEYFTGMPVDTLSVRKPQR